MTIKERHKFRILYEDSELKEEITSSKSRFREDNQKLSDEIEIKLPLLDFNLLKHEYSIKRIDNLNTEITPFQIRPIKISISDISLSQEILSIIPPQLDTNHLIFPKKDIQYKIADIIISSKKHYKQIRDYDTSLNQTDLSEITVKTGLVPDLIIQEEINIKSIIELDTNLYLSDLEIDLINDFFAGSLSQLPVFEEYIKCDRKLPRSFGEANNSPIVILIEEDQNNWHFPILYILKELFREITDRYPIINFRESELWNEGTLEILDSVDPHSLERFTFDSKIDFLDARKMHLAVQDFLKIAKGRLKSGYLKQFGMLVIAIKSDYLKTIQDEIRRIPGIQLYLCQPEKIEDNRLKIRDKYNNFCARIFGLTSSEEFFFCLTKFEEGLKKTLKKFSVFVKRDPTGSDIIQYPLKVAVFEYLLQLLIKRENKKITTLDELYEYISNEVIGKKIKIEKGYTQEESNRPKKNIITDIVFNSNETKDIFIEVETLIGNYEPMKKIDETIDKYRDFNDKEIIWIVFKPISVILHYNELNSRLKVYKKLYENHSKSIEFKVLTLLTTKKQFKWNLIDIKHFKRGLTIWKSLIKNSKKK